MTYTSLKRFLMGHLYRSQFRTKFINSSLTFAADASALNFKQLYLHIIFFLYRFSMDTTAVSIFFFVLFRHKYYCCIHYVTKSFYCKCFFPLRIPSWEVCLSWNFFGKYSHSWYRKIIFYIQSQFAFFNFMGSPIQKCVLDFRWHWYPVATFSVFQLML